VNLSPADIRKEGSSFDLPIAVSILSSLGLISHKNVGDEKIMIAGELSLSGKILPMNGVLPMVIAAREKGIKTFIVPRENAKEGAVIKDVNIYGMSSLRDVISFLNGTDYESEPFVDFYNMYENLNEINREQLDFADISGQEAVKRAAKIAVAGMHHMLLIGTPGSGKSMIAKRIPGILPRPDMEECMEITKIHSIAGQLKGSNIKLNRPFRAPHHSVTDKALIGGGSNPRPGEITLAHRGVLFLDELAEFKRDTIDALRQPLETGEVIINRLNGTYIFPACIMLVAATNPCKCGYYPDKNRCSCSEMQVKNYLGKISGPILDRIDICINTPPVMVEDIGKKSAENSESIRSQVEVVRRIQEERFKGESYKFNSQITASKLEEYCPLSIEAKKLIDKAYKSLGLSVRVYHKLIRVARTIADLEGSMSVEEKHIAEALGYRTEIF
jgi:magnesium chelatase family protein